MSQIRSIRKHVARVLGWPDAHATLDAAVAGLAPELRGVRPAGLPHSPWELLEHIRITQRDILDFTLSTDYRELAWPADYWPPQSAPPSDTAWDTSLEAALADRQRLEETALDERIDLVTRIPNGTDQSYLRELLLAADHTSYHLGQLVLVRRALGAWPPPEQG